MIHGGRDPSVRAPATLDAIEALLAAGRLDEPIAPRTRRRLSAAAHDRASRADGRRRANAPAAGRSRRARQCRAAARTCRRRGAARSAAAARRASRRRFSTALRPSERRQLSNDPDIARGRACASLGFADPAAAARHIARLALGQGAVAALAGRAAGVRGDAARPAARDRRGRRPGPMRSTGSSDIVERLSSGVNFFRLLEARPPLAQLLAKMLAHAPALADQLGRRPELFEGLFDASSFAMPPPAAEFAAAPDRRHAGPAVRRRRSTAPGGWSTSAGSRSACS